MAIFSGPIFSQSAALKPETKGAAAATDATKKTLSTRIVAYEIEAKLDPTKHTIAASETLTYQNLTGQPQQTFPFHLYLNAFQPQSTFMTEVRRSGTRGNGPDTPMGPQTFRLDHRRQTGSRRRGRFDRQDGIHTAGRPEQGRPHRFSSHLAETDSARRVCAVPHRLSTTCFPKSSNVPATPTISIWSASGSRRSAFGGKMPGTAISSTPTPNFSRTSELST